ncbi:MAG: CHAT domain-containing protein [Pseudonocardiaceae bacterium]
MTTLDLELEVGRGTGGGYPLVARAPGGEVAVTMRLPLTFAELDHELAVVQDEVLSSWVARRRAATDDEQPARMLGRQLFDALIAGEVRDLYTASRERARAQNSALRLVVRVRPAELARLPWEFLFDSDQQDYLGVSLPLVHYPEVLAPRQPLRVAAPLRILGMVARPGGQPAPDVDEEQQRLRAALAGPLREGLVELGWVAGPTYGDLEEALNQGPWHAFHFVDHGRHGQVADERAVAATPEGDRARPVGAGDVSGLLADHHTLRLVVLSARDTGCDTERGGGPDAFAGTAGALVRRGVPAVVAMQFAITDPAAILFAQTFYDSVAKLLPVDTGVTRARQAMRLANEDTLEWGTPALYLRTPDGRIFTSATPPSDQAESQPLDPAENQPSTPEVESLYDEALAAFWTEQWDQAVALLHKVLAHRPGHPDATAKLEQARREQDLATRYAQTRGALDTGDWEQAIAGFALLADLNPGYLDVRDLLEDARRRQEDAALAAQAQELQDPASALPDVPRIARHPRAGQILHTRKEVSAVAFSPDGCRLATAGSKNVAQVWDATDGHELLSVGSKAWRRGMEGVVFSPDGHWLATASDDGTARIWDATSGEELLQVTHDGQVWGLAFSPDGRWLATAGDDGTARIWEATGGAELLNIPHDNWVRGLAFSPDGCWLATGGVDRTARVWDAVSGREFAKVTHDSVVWGVAFSPNGRWLATASDDGTARIWDAALGEELLEVRHDSGVLRVAFSPDGAWLATASQDGTARVWDLATEQELAVVAHADQVWGLVFSPDGRRLATGSSDKTARIWVLIEDSDDAEAPLVGTPQMRPR